MSAAISNKHRSVTDDWQSTQHSVIANTPLNDIHILNTVS